MKVTYSKDDAIRTECKRLVAEGWTPKNGGRHVRLVSPSGRHTITVPQTARGCTRENWMHQMRRTERQERAIV